VFGEDNRGNVYNLIDQIVSGRFMMVGSGQNYKSMCYVGNVACFLSKQVINNTGYKVFNYADKPDLSTSEIVSIIKSEMGISGKSLNLPYPLGLFGGYAFDILSKITGKKFPISAVRIKKFCADSTIDANATIASGFKPPYSLEQSLKAMVKHEFK
jgi:nucleoside-diphosphate-sugar epimerase